MAWRPIPIIQRIRELQKAQRLIERNMGVQHNKDVVIGHLDREIAKLERAVNN